MPTCPSCGGSGLCKWCSPRGSGKNSDGTACQMCKGTGRCNDENPRGYRCYGTGQTAK